MGLRFIGVRKDVLVGAGMAMGRAGDGLSQSANSSSNLVHLIGIDKFPIKIYSNVVILV